MDIQQLRCFVATAKYGKIQDAADSLFISRQAVSKTLAQLEDELGQPLFIRTHNGISVNEHGKRFLDRAVTLIRDFETLCSEMRETDEICRVRICFPFTTHHYFWNILNSFLTENKDKFLVEAVNCLDAQCHTLLDSGAVDMAVSLLPFKSGVDAGILVASSPMLAAVNEADPLARKSILTREDFGDTPLIYYLNGYDELFWLAKDYPEPAYAVNDILLAFDLVLQNKGVFPVPELSILQPMHGMVFVPYSGPDDCDNFYCGITEEVGRDKQKLRTCLALRKVLAGAAK